MFSTLEEACGEPVLSPVEGAIASFSDGLAITGPFVADASSKYEFNALWKLKKSDDYICI